MGGNDEAKAKSGSKRSRTYYKKCMYKKRKKWNSIDVGMRGFLVTCNRNESQAVKEMYNLLNEYADVLYGPEHVSSFINSIFCEIKRLAELLLYHRKYLAFLPALHSESKCHPG